MLTTNWLLAVGFIFTIVLTIAIERLGRGSGGRLWALSWCCLYGSALLSDLTRTWAAAGFVFPILTTGFAAFLYAGSLRFAGHEIPRWLLPLAILDICIRPWMQLAISLPLLHSLDAVVVGVASIASVRALLSEARPSHSSAPWYLIAAIPLFAISNVLYALTAFELLPEGTGVFAGLTAGTLMAIAQLGALFERAAQRANDEHATLRALLEALPIGIALSDRDDNIHTLNRAFADQLDLDAKEFVGQPLERIIDHARKLVRPSDPLPNGQDGVGAFGESRRLNRSELSFKNGRSAIADSRPVRRGPPGASPIGHLWFLRDVTEERRIHRDLQEARQLETLARLAGGVAHDFNNKLTAVLGNASLLHESIASDDWRADALVDLEEAAQYCAALTRDLLDFARQSPTRSAALPTEETLQEIASNLRAMLPEGIVFAVETKPGTPLLSADPAQLERVITNLVFNARDACGENGRIKILASRCDEDGSVEIRVSDDGAGMSQETRERVFDPFYSTKEIGQGTGLGLAIVFGIVKSHGGRIEVETEPGVGTTFVTRWPAANSVLPREPRQTEKPAERSGAVQAERILVVEDEAPVRRVLCTTLERAGYQVIQAENGESALEIADELGGEFDLAVVDLTMPGISGKETIEALRARNPGVPAILVSGHFGQSNDEAALPGPSPERITHLAKPFLPHELVAAARAAMGTSS